MSDPKSSYGEPVEEPGPVDDVVGQANAGLADAEAARREEADADAASDPAPEEAAPAAEESVSEDAATTAYAAPVEEPVVSAAEPEPAPVTDAAAPVSGETPYTERSYDVPSWAEETETSSVEAEPAYAAPAPSPQPIFVQAPEAPRPRGNRAAAGAIGVLAAVTFAVLYLAAWLGFGAIEGTVTVENVGTVALEALGTAALWVPVVVFFLSFWLLGAVINRGRWGAWVIFGLLVGLAAYGGHILGQLFQAPFWLLTAREGAELVEGQLLAPLAIVAFVLGRELTIWYGAWVASRGKRVTELNTEAQREYERTLEAGPQLVRP
ncbi:ABC transporter [Microbacterium aquimaris]|uniref:ABC transporter n=1 Tax=Microbacterium aquimaris TaxID=459816 RepID=A0ABU5N4Q8_9MICO|nr:ABC transporter [Microbacterium aquimaris]MDZ8161084.1 ABC transporter [Microbacterium aquimaris]